MDSLSCKLRVFRIELHQDSIAAEAIGDNSGGAGAPERVQHGAALRAACQDAGLDELGWEGGEVGVAIRLGAEGTRH